MKDLQNVSLNTLVCSSSEGVTKNGPRSSSSTSWRPVDLLILTLPLHLLKGRLRSSRWS